MRQHGLGALKGAKEKNMSERATHRPRLLVGGWTLSSAAFSLNLMWPPHAQRLEHVPPDSLDVSVPFSVRGGPWWAFTKVRKSV